MTEPEPACDGDDDACSYFRAHKRLRPTWPHMHFEWEPNISNGGLFVAVSVFGPGENKVTLLDLMVAIEPLWLIIDP